MPDAVVVGAGPNGLAAAIEIARAGHSVAVYEANDEVGGGVRSAELTLPGFVHDVCSAIHPMAKASPFFNSLRLREHGLEWIDPPAPLAHPLDDGTAAVLERSVDDTARGLGADGDAYRRLVAPFVERWDRLFAEIMRPVLHLPRHPLGFARFGLRALFSSRFLARSLSGDAARALVAGVAAHSFLPIDHPFTAGFALVFLITGNAVGWPLPRGGSRRIGEALATKLRELGGTITTGKRIQDMNDLPTAGAYLFDTSPWHLENIAADQLPAGFRRALRHYRRGPGVFKIDYALAAPVPWRASDCLRAGTVHLGGTFEEIAASEAAVWRGEHPERPFVLIAQQSLFDPSRAPAGQHTLWAYCHVPNGSTEDMTARVEAQIERFAPGFRERVLARSVMNTRDIERRNANNAGGDISVGAHSGTQIVLRPTWGLDPYATPARDIYLCSSATPPGGGVHGMCGANAARSALRRSLS